MSKAKVIWLTGLSGAGKTTIAKELIADMENKGIACELLDGDVIRTMFPGTGFSKEARNAHVKRVAYVASLLQKHGVTTIVSLISPYRESRDFARDICAGFNEIHVATTLEECERRDVKGLYAKVRSGEIKNFTGIDDPYEEPESPEMRLDTVDMTPEQVARTISAYLELGYTGDL